MCDHVEMNRKKKKVGKLRGLEGTKNYKAERH